MKASSEGIYFVVRFPEGWELITFRSDEHPDPYHDWCWSNVVVGWLARAWVLHFLKEKPKRGGFTNVKKLENKLDVCYDGFPRGRVCKVDNHYFIFHGNNLSPDMKVSKKMIETAFGIAGRAVWRFDIHEQCSEFSSHEIQRVLNLRERWKIAQITYD